MTKTNAISLQVLALIASGVDPVEALKQVCGSENVDKMIGELYDALRANAK
jgi:hypothetical protein